MECWYIVVVLDLIQYEDPPPVDAPHGPRKVAPSARLYRRAARPHCAHSCAQTPRAHKGEGVIVDDVVVVVVVGFILY